MNILPQSPLIVSTGLDLVVFFLHSFYNTNRSVSTNCCIFLPFIPYVFQNDRAPTSDRSFIMKRSLAITFVILSSFFFALGGLFFKIISWNALAISSARSILGGIAVLIYMLITRQKFHFNRSVLIAALGHSVCSTLYSLSNKLTTAGNAIVLQFTMPVFVILLMLILYRKKPTLLEGMTCLFVLLGIVCFFVDSLTAGNMLGNLLALISGMSYAVMFIANSQKDSDPFTAILIAYMISTLIGLPALLHTNIATAPVSELLAVVALGIIQQGGGQIFFALGIKHTPPITASLVSGMEPVLNPILVAIFYHEMLTPLSLVGAAIVLLTIVFYNVRSAAK